MGTKIGENVFTTNQACPQQWSGRSKLGSSGYLTKLKHGFYAVNALNL